MDIKKVTILDHLTSHEETFLMNLGMDKFSGLRKFDRKTLLKKYIKAAEKRTDWSGINKIEAIVAAHNFLRMAD